MYQKRCNGIIHEVKKGDSLYTISREHNVPLESVMLANPDVDVYNLQVGSKVCVPIRREMKPVYTKMPVNDKNMNTEVSMQNDMSRNMTTGTYMDTNMDTNMSMNTDLNMDTNMDANMSMDTDMFMDTQDTGNAVNYMGDTFAYIVRDGDSMQHLMNKFNTTPEEIFRHNSMENMLFKPGITIIIPNR